MKERQRKILEAPRFLMYPLGVVLFGAFAWDFFKERSGSSSALGSVIDTLEAAEQPFLFLFFGLFWLLLGALVIELVRREMTSAAEYRVDGRPILTLKSSNLVDLLVLVPIVLMFVAAMNLWVFAPETLLVQIDAPDAFGWMIFWFFYCLAHFLLVAFLVRALRNRPFFVATGQGFIYEPGGLSMGFVRWKDVSEVTETELVFGSGGGPAGAPYLSRALVITLRNPEHYASRLSAPMGWLQRLGSRYVNWQVDKAGDIVIDPRELRQRYADVRKVMVEMVGTNGGTIVFE